MITIENSYALIIDQCFLAHRIIRPALLNKYTITLPVCKCILISFRFCNSTTYVTLSFSSLKTDQVSLIVYYYKLPIELGRFWGTERDDTICELRRLDKLGDEYHYLFECSYFEEQRRMFLPRGLPRQPNMAIFNEVMNSKDKFALFKLGDTR